MAPADPTPASDDTNVAEPVDLDVAEPVETNVAEPVDLDVIERDLAAVERALERLSDGTYWTDEVTGEQIPEHVLAVDPTARRA